MRCKLFRRNPKRYRAQLTFIIKEHQRMNEVRKKWDDFSEKTSLYIILTLPLTTILVAEQVLVELLFIFTFSVFLLTSRLFFYNLYLTNHVKMYVHEYAFLCPTIAIAIQTGREKKCSMECCLIKFFILEFSANNYIL